MTDRPSTQTDPLNVLLWSPRGSSENYSGPGSFAYRLYSTDDRDRFRLTLAHARADQPQRDLFQTQYDYGPTGSGFSSIRAMRRGSAWVKQHAQGFDVFHGLGAYHETVLPAWHAQKAGLPAVVFVASHQAELADKKGFTKRLLNLPKQRRRMIRDLSALVAMSDAVAEELLGYGVDPARIARIPMGVNTSHFHPPDDEAGRRLIRDQLGWADRPTVIFSGELSRNKQPHLLIEAMGQAVRDGLDAQLVLMGPASQPEYAREMKARADDLKVSDRVIWLGFVKDPAPYYRAADVFCLPSLREGMSAALVEAMASGLACVSTRISGSTDLITPGVNGELTQPLPGPVSEAVIAYLQDPQVGRTHGAVSRQRVEQSYSHHAVLDAYEALFRKIRRR